MILQKKLDRLVLHVSGPCFRGFFPKKIYKTNWDKSFTILGRFGMFFIINIFWNIFCEFFVVEKKRGRKVK